MFSWLHKEGGLSEEEMARTFNCGLGAVLVVSPVDAQRVLRQLEGLDEAWIVGSLAHKQPGETLDTLSPTCDVIQAQLLKEAFLLNCRGRTRGGPQPGAQTAECRTRLRWRVGGQAEWQHAAQEDQSRSSDIWHR